MRVLVDSREKAPWSFDGQAGIETVVRHLTAGDYSVDGIENRVAIERKSLDDWVRTVVRERSRFYRELERLRAYDYRCVIIEASVREIVAGQYRSEVRPESVLGFVAEVSVAQSVPVLLGGSRAESQILAGALLRMSEKKLGQRSPAGR